jgi:hypothetical protein
MIGEWDNELERMWKEAVVAELRNYPGVALKVMRKLRKKKNQPGSPGFGPPFELMTPRVQS